MITENQGASSTPEIASGDVQKENQTQIEEKKDVVSYESHQKLLNQLKKTKEANRELTSKFSDIKNDARKKEEDILASKGEFQKIVELREAELEGLKAENIRLANEKDTAKNDLQDTWKLQAFYDKLPGKIKRREYLNFVDLESIALNPESGEVDEKSVDVAVNSFMNGHKDLVDTSHFGSLPSNAGTTLTQLDANKFKDLPLNEMRGNLKEAVQIARKKLGV